jgi:hypothetical protein
MAHAANLSLKNEMHLNAMIAVIFDTRIHTSIQCFQVVKGGFNMNEKEKRITKFNAAGLKKYGSKWIPVPDIGNNKSRNFKLLHKKALEGKNLIVVKFVTLFLRIQKRIK